MEFPGQDIVPPRYLAEVKRVRTYFKDKGQPSFKFERVLGTGARGFAVEIRVKDDTSSSLAPKRTQKPSLQPASLRGPTPAKKRIERLRGARNIQQIYRLPNEKEDLKLDFLPGPTLFTEWIPNGQIRDLLTTRVDWDHPLPNRMLWRFFLCMCHMLIAMAWPPEGNPNAPSIQPDLLPSDASGARARKSTIRHNDLNIGNIMFGDFDSITHQLTPILKLIDFGQASNSTESFTYTEESAVRQNMLRVAEVMVNMMGGAVVTTMSGTKDMEVTINGVRRTIKSRARDLDGLNRGWGASNAVINKQRQWLDNLDADLRNLLVRCLATEERWRPSLEELFEEVRSNVERKTWGSYAGKRWQENETDASLRTLSRELIVNRRQ